MSNTVPEGGTPLQHVEALLAWLDSAAESLPPAEAEDAKQHLTHLGELIKQSQPEGDSGAESDAQAGTDDFLGVHAPDALLIEGRRAFDRCRTECQAMVLLALDIDKIHRIENNYGKLTAEAVLKMVLALVRRKLRKTDIVGRHDAFGLVVILPGCPLSRARVLSEELCQTVEEATEPKSGLHVTISVGVAAPGTATDTLGALLDQGLQALRSAQSSGGNSVVVSR